MADRSQTARRPGESTEAYASRLRDQAIVRMRERKPAPLVFIAPGDEPYSANGDDD